jgi:hypothetical protein
MSKTHAGHTHGMVKQTLRYCSVDGLYCQIETKVGEHEDHNPVEPGVVRQKEGR